MPELKEIITQEKIQRQQELMETLEEYFTRGVDQKKFVDVSRIPLICQDIKGIHSFMRDINDKLDKKFVTKDSFWPVKTLVYGAAGTMLASILLALIYLVINK